MKKISSRSVRDSLTVACCSLLHPAGNAQAGLLDNVEADSAVLVYSESDGRVSLIEPAFKFKSEVGEDKYLSLQLVFDSLSGATPNGAQESDVAQTFSSPSGEDTYTVQPGDMPLEHFQDTRAAANVTYEKPINRLSKNIWNASLSKESDWLSLGAGYTFTHDFNQRNTTLSTGIGLTSDTISPTGGAPVPLTLTSAGNKEGDKSRTSADLIVGITQVLGKNTISQLNLGLSQSSGYHTDPFKLVSVINDTPPSLFYGKPTGDYLYESRPDSRQRQTVFWKIVHHLPEDVINFSYRYYTDDWGINAHTADLKYRINLSDRTYLQPHIRYYTQTAADFYRHSLLASETVPDFVSADYRLAAFDGITYGLKYGKKLAKNSEVSGRVELIQQTGNSHPADAIGEQLNHDLYPGLTAVVLQLSYSLTW